MAMHVVQRGPGHMVRGAPSSGSSTLMSLDFTAVTPESGGFGVARALPALTYAETTAGALTSFAANTARRTDKGLLVEGSRTNLIPRSQEFDDAAWFRSVVACTPNTTAAPDGTTTADTLSITGGTDTLRPNTDITVTASTAYVFSFYAKRGTMSDTKYSVYNVTGAADIVAATSYYASTNTSTWVRIVVPFTTPVGCTSVRVFLLRDSASTNGTVFLWGAQLEAGAYVSSYIPTAAASVTRSADVITKSVSVPSATSLTVSMAMTTTRATSATRTAFDWNDSSASNRILSEMDSTNHVLGRIINGGTPTTIATEGGTPAAARNYAMDELYAASSWTLKVDAATIGANAAALPAATKICLGANWDASSFLDDYIRSLTIVSSTGSVAALPVGPQASWDGTLTSGTAYPGASTEVNYIAMGRWLSPSFERVTGSRYNVWLDADCFGGVASVTFKGAIPDTVVAKTGEFVIGANGVTRWQEGYKLSLDPSAFYGKPGVPTGTIAARVWAEVAAVQSGTFTTRVTPVLTFYPEPSNAAGAAAGYPECDWVGYFSNTSGVTDPKGTTAYNGLRAGLDAMMTAITGGARNPILLCMTTATYEAASISGYGTEANYKTPAGGYARVYCTSGVTCTIGKAAFDVDNTNSSWYFYPGMGAMEWGPGIVFNTAQMIAEMYPNGIARPTLYRGAKWTNTAGRDSLPWNLAPARGRGPEGVTTTRLPCYFIDCTAEDGRSPWNDKALIEIGNRSLRTYDDLHTGNPVIYGCFDKDSSSQFFRAYLDEVAISYSGSGTGSLQRTGGNGGTTSSDTIVLSDIAGSVTIKFAETPGSYDATPTAPRVWSFAQLKSVIEARATGWTVTLQGSGGTRAARYITRTAAMESGSIGDVNTWPTTTITSTPQVFRSIVDKHGDWRQGDFENVFIKNNILTSPSNNLNAHMFMSQGGTSRGLSCKGNTWDGPNSGTPQKIPTDAKHVLWEQNWSSEDLQLTNWNDAYSQFINNAGESLSYTGTWPALPVITGNRYRTGSWLNTGNSANNGTLTGTQASLFADQVNGDYRPAGDLLNNKRTASGYDPRGRARAATDAPGAFGDGGSAYANPF